jgi:UDP-N-acetylglucosamine 2-epimerase
MHIVSVVGARPEFIQASPVSRELRGRHREVLVHTGQHYDHQMCETFFEQLNIPMPNYDLGVGSGSHGRQTAEIMMRLEPILLDERPDLVIVRGDTNSTLAGGLAAAKLRIPLAHIEAGERSFVKHMPEEINRVMVDRLADVHFCASRQAQKQLADEGITRFGYWVGDVMLDAMLSHLPIARRSSDALRRLDLQPGQYTLVTVHRNENTTDPFRLRRIFHALNQTHETIIFPMHPRTQDAVARFGATLAGHVKVIPPVGYFDMLMLEENARLVVTDSGGVQREAYFLGKPCLTLRDETEWVETVECGWNRLVGTEPESILDGWFHFVPPSERPAIFGDGTAAHRVAEILDNGVLICNSAPEQQMEMSAAQPAPAEMRSPS